jgi:Raf kinase inhibitor-like YbhB/YbcL family protein
MFLISSAFRNGAEIPRQHACDGDDRSPPLRWSGAPKNTKSFVLLCIDCDAPTGVWRHWGVYDIPAYHTELVEGAGLPEGFEDFRHAMNDFGHFGYNGPCPRHGAVHHYRFRLLALDRAELPIRTHPTCEEVEKETRRHVIAQAVLTGFYHR